MTSKGHVISCLYFLVLRPMCAGLGLSLQQSTLLGFSWTFPWGEGSPNSPSVKIQSLRALRQTKPSGPGSDLIYAGQENPAQLVITPVHEESAPSSTHAL